MDEPRYPLCLLQVDEKGGGPPQGLTAHLKTYLLGPLGTGGLIVVGGTNPSFLVSVFGALGFAGGGTGLLFIQIHSPKLKCTVKYCIVAFSAAL